MEFNAIQIILVAVWAFICGIDQFSLTEAIYRPLVSCTVMGLILGDLSKGLQVGAAFEIITIGQMPIGGAQPPNPVVGGVMAAVFGIGSGLDTEAAVSLAIPFALFGQFCVNVMFTLMAGFMHKADQYAAEANTKGIVKLNWGAMVVLGLFFSAIAVAGLIGGTAAGEFLQKFLTDYAWVNTGLNAGGGMMKFVGFGILLKIMMAKDLWGFFFTGFAASVVIGSTSVASATIILLAIIGVTIAIYDYQVNTRFKSVTGSVASKGDEEDGI